MGLGYVFPYTLSDNQVSVDYKYHKISGAWSKDFLCDHGYFRGDQDDRFIAVSVGLGVFKGALPVC